MSEVKGEGERISLRRKIAGNKAYLSRLDNAIADNLRSSKPTSQIIARNEVLVAARNARYEKFRALVHQLRSLEGRE